jgi:hypothetical protein
MELALARIEMLYIEKDSVHWEMFKNDCMEKEKEQIINFAYEILETSDEHQSGYVSIEEIYNQTYNQNK